MILNSNCRPKDECSLVVGQHAAREVEGVAVAVHDALDPVAVQHLVGGEGRHRRAENSVRGGLQPPQTRVFYPCIASTALFIQQPNLSSTGNGKTKYWTRAKIGMGAAAIYGRWKQGLELDSNGWQESVLR